MRYVIRERLFRLGEDSDITDEQGQPVFHVDHPFVIFSLHATFIVRDMVGTEVVRVKRANWKYALHATYRITRQGEEVAEVRKKLFSPFVDRFTIDIPGPHDLQMTGSLFEHEYTITRDDQVVATVSKRWLSLTETYGVETAPDEDDVLILASVLALDLAEDREREERHERRDRD